MKEKRVLQQILTLTALFLLLSALLVIVFDPFYHYHAPLPGLKAVLNEKEYQCIGTLRHFTYDAVIAGSSMIENCDNAVFDEAFACTTVKAARSYGSIADLLSMLSTGYENHTIRYVFFNLDPASLHGSPETTFAETGCPLYLYDKNPMNDVNYLWNKDVLLKRIPYEIAQSLSPSYRENLSYSWAEGKNFSKEGALSQYYRLPDTVAKKREVLPADANEAVLAENLRLLTDFVREHKETDFLFYFPAYSVLWWDMMERNGELEATFYEIRKAANALLEEENAKVYLFLADSDTVTNLDNYMDPMHHTPEINLREVIYLKEGTFRLTKETADGAFSALEETVREEFSGRLIPALEKEDAFLYDYSAE